MKKVRFGIIGVGNMGSGHLRNITEGKIPNVEITGVCDIDQAKLERAKEINSEITTYIDYKDLLKDENVDAVLIATPHYDHPVMAIEAFKAGKHVLTEKPAGVYTKTVREMNEAAEKSDRVFGIMYNQRTNPVYGKVKELIDAGELGEIRRVNWIITSWYRTQSYYNSGGWRATWAGEGGGVLINQDPHQLDLWQWICGMPNRVRAFCHFGKMHDIEVEDDVTAYVEYPNGATGVFVTSTSDCPGTNRLEITGDRGKMIIENNEIKFWRLTVPEREYNATATSGFKKPDIWECKINSGKQPEHGGHCEIMKNFANAVLSGTELIAPGEEGINGLTISNAMHLSAWTDNWVELPIDEDLYYEKLQEQIKNSKFVKKEVKSKAVNLNGTY